MTFTKREAAKQSFIKRLFGFKHADALAAELEGVIAQHWPRSLPTRQEVAEIETRHGIRLATRGIAVGRNLLQLAADATTSRLPLKAPLHVVEQLATSLGLPHEEATRALKTAGHALLRREVERALGDEKITQQERQTLDAAAREVGLNNDDVVAAIVEQIAPLYSDRVHQALADGKLSPDEEDGLSRLASSLGLTPQHDSNLRDAMDRARSLWAVMHGPLPQVEPPFYLQKNERCAFAVEAEVFEQRLRTKSVGYRGASVSIPIVKGFRIRVGQGRVHRETEQYQHSFGKGTFCATNKRLIWNGPNKNIAINLTKIIDFEPFTDGVRVEKDTGKPLLIVFSSEEKSFGPLLSRLLEESRR